MEMPAGFAKRGVIEIQDELIATLEKQVEGLRNLNSIQAKVVIAQEKIIMNQDRMIETLRGLAGAPGRLA